MASCDLLKIHYLCGDKDNKRNVGSAGKLVVICSKFITFAVTKTTLWACSSIAVALWFAQNSLPLRWQRQRNGRKLIVGMCCDLLKIHYLCGDKDNEWLDDNECFYVVICSKFITFAVTKTTQRSTNSLGCSCDLLKIHYLCGDKDNRIVNLRFSSWVVICSKFITFAVTKTTSRLWRKSSASLWFAQNSLPLRWQRQQNSQPKIFKLSCDLLKIHYLCGDKDNQQAMKEVFGIVVICSKFITFAVTKTTRLFDDI